MGILGMFKKKDELAQAPDPFPQYPPQDQQDPYSFDQPAQDAGFDQPYDSPEAAGFERIPKNQWQSSQNVGEISMGKDLELINAKLDAIKAELDSVNQRLKRIERLAEEPLPQTRKDVWNY